ncbi:hypothetical protein NE237_002915 [Protea cynaroides]|uniref:Uncharacterized protein n=1 Tax=Protea cynaroides TaxID=273540 RepID=A0A9Q0KGD8_9MAGN|nr:hypothetical protein NE237_002915 [Protea cynaroides]
MESVSLDKIYKAYYHLEPCYRSKKNIGSPSGSQIFSIEKIKKNRSRRRSNRHRNKVRIARMKYQKSRSEVRFSKLPRGISDLSTTNQIRCLSFHRCTTAVAVAPDHNCPRRTKSPLLLLFLLPSLCSRLSLPHSQTLFSLSLLLSSFSCSLHFFSN